MSENSAQRMGPGYKPSEDAMSKWPERGWLPRGVRAPPEEGRGREPDRSCSGQRSGGSAGCAGEDTEPKKSLGTRERRGGVIK